MRVQIIKQFKDNYSYLIQALQNSPLLIDCGQFFELPLNSEPTVLTTHCHWDHVNGLKQLKYAYPDAAIYGARSVPFVTNDPLETNSFKAAGFNIKPIATPGHSKSGISYYLPDLKSLFTGDTLFVGGCGRILDGNPKELFESLSRLSALPPMTSIYCGHEYTVKNLEFAHDLLRNDENIKNKLDWAITMRERNLPTVPSLLQSELETNVFLMCNHTAFQKRFGIRDPLELFFYLRELKDSF